MANIFTTFAFMSCNTFGLIFRLTTFGESHGPATGGVVDGCPSNLVFDTDFIQSRLDRRSPGHSAGATARHEPDKIEFLSGIFEGRTTGAPIAFMIQNQDHKSGDYEAMKGLFRPSHADYTWLAKYGHRDYRGGGRSSARETAARVAGGAIAQLALRETGMSFHGFVSQMGPVRLQTPLSSIDTNEIDNSAVRCPDPAATAEMLRLLEELQKAGDTCGGVVTCCIRNVPTGLGAPVFDKLHADLAKAMMSIPAAKGFDVGSGFESAGMKGSEHNDLFLPVTDTDADPPGKIRTLTNRSGGVQGGISNGEDLLFRVAFKPVPTLSRTQQTVDLQGRPALLEGKGRHDICIAPRAVPVVEAMAALVLADHYFRAQAIK